MTLVGLQQPRPQRFASIKELIMAKVIEFYVPSVFGKPLKGARRRQRAKVIEARGQGNQPKQ
jgi:hypothetical protein